MAALVLLCRPAVGLAQGAQPGIERILSIRVRDSVSQALLADVRLSQGMSDRSTVTDSAGIARLRVPASRETRIVARHVGFAPKEIMVARSETDDSLTVWLVPVTEAQALPTVAVRAPPTAAQMRYADFERRRTSGRTGIFIADDELRKHDSSILTDLFRRYAGIKVIDSLGVKFIASSRSPKAIISPRSAGAKEYDLAPCILRIMMDGVSMPEGLDVSVFQVRELHAIEVYVGPATTPVEFAGMIKDSQCGVVMLWTRNR